eukprot:2047206-Karenia_brevis.AAC.1
MPRQPARRSMPKASWHEWQADGLDIRCSKCLRVHDADLGDAPMVGCPGSPAVLRHVQQSFGHVLRMCDTKDGSPFYFCAKCGGWALRKA